MASIFAKSATRKSNQNPSLDGATKKGGCKMNDETREPETDRLETVKNLLSKLVIEWRSISQKRKKIQVIRKKITLRAESGNNYKEAKINNKLLRRISSLFFHLEEKNEYLLTKINELECEKYDLEHRT